MTQIFLTCKNCKRIFPSGIDLGAGATAIFSDNVSRCPFCGSWENIPDGTFKSTVEGTIQLLEQSENPLQLARELLETLEKSKNTSDLSKIKNSSKYFSLRKWIPDSVEKLAIYISIIYTIVQLLRSHPETKIDYTAFINVYNQVVNTQMINIKSKQK